MSSDPPPPRTPKPRWYEEGGQAKARIQRSAKHERRLAKAIGGRRLPGSGNRPYSATDRTSAKGDVASPDFHVEHKYTMNRSMSLKRDWLEKVAEGAARCAKTPLMILTFDSLDKRKREDHVLVPLEAFRRLCRGAGIDMPDEE